jgi:uncharacterized alkaline shock family protein YloU
MTNVGYNAPQYGYGGGVPPQPMPMPMPASNEPDNDDAPAPAVASYDVNPSAGHAPPLVVQPPTAPITLEKAEEEAAAEEAPEPTAPEREPTGPGPEPTAAEREAAAPEPTTPEPTTPAAPTSPASSGRVAVQVVDRLRSTAERGTTTVPTPVIEKIATLAVREVPGVHEFATGSAGGEKPISINLDGRTATIEIHLVIEYGFAVHSVTEKVRTKVISALENLFGLDVTAVDIVIDDIHLEDAETAVE